MFGNSRLIQHHGLMNQPRNRVDLFVGEAQPIGQLFVDFTVETPEQGWLGKALTPLVKVIVVRLVQDVVQIDDLVIGVLTHVIIENKFVDVGFNAQLIEFILNQPVQAQPGEHHLVNGILVPRINLDIIRILDAHGKTLGALLHDFLGQQPLHQIQTIHRPIFTNTDHPQ